MSAAQPSGTRSKSAFSVAEYLALERASQDRHEYHDGPLVAMAGEARPHGIISANLVVVLGGQLLDKPNANFTRLLKRCLCHPCGEAMVLGTGLAVPKPPMTERKGLPCVAKDC
jgi:predicted house-cleaning NTP pyrophosphatase (Maf/HAM1 superfamily)